MKLHDIDQRSDAWRRARLGIPTASRFGDIMTAKAELRTGEMPKKYMCELIAERITGEPTTKYETVWMRRGNELEPMAREAFAEHLGVTLSPGGFVTTDDGKLGCSPDAIISRIPHIKGHVVNVREGVELKVPMPHNHVYNLCFGLGDNYVQQVQGQCYIGEFDYVHFYSWNPGLPSFHMETRRDDAFIAKMREILTLFCAELDEKERYVRSLIAEGADAPKALNSLNPF